MCFCFLFFIFFSVILICIVEVFSFGEYLIQLVVKLSILCRLLLMQILATFMRHGLTVLIKNSCSASLILWLIFVSTAVPV